jgi:hypothetical protein
MKHKHEAELIAAVAIFLCTAIICLALWNLLK